MSLNNLQEVLFIQRLNPYKKYRLQQETYFVIFLQCCINAGFGQGFTFTMDRVTALISGIESEIRMTAFFA